MARDGHLAASSASPGEAGRAGLDAGHLCKGKFFFGLGLGYEIEEFQAFGIERKTRVGRFEESLEVIRMLWTQDTVTFHGRHFTWRTSSLRCGQYKSPTLRSWIAANNYPAIRRAARLGAVFFASPHAHNGTLREQIAVYKEAVAESFRASAGGHSRSQGHLRSGD